MGPWGRAIGPFFSTGEPMSEQKIYNLGNKAFKALKQSTIEHDFWLMDTIRAAGLEQVTLRPGEEAETFATRLLHDVIASGRVFDLLGGVLVPADSNDLDWTPEAALQTAAFMRKLSEPTDKILLQSLVVELLIGFFQDGLVALMLSPNYSATSPENHQDSETGEHTTLATGT